MLLGLLNNWETFNHLLELLVYLFALNLRIKALQFWVENVFDFKERLEEAFLYFVLPVDTLN